MTCRHRTSWIFGAGLEWCWACGAFRYLTDVFGKANAVSPDSPWQRPVGPRGENPHEAFVKRRAAFVKARRTRAINRARRPE